MSERKQDALTELRELAGKVGTELEQMEREGDYSVHAEPIRRAYRRILQMITACEEELRHTHNRLDRMLRKLEKK
jgi:hypothetical protein